MPVVIIRGLLSSMTSLQSTSAGWVIGWMGRSLTGWMARSLYGCSEGWVARLLERSLVIFQLFDS